MAISTERLQELEQEVRDLQAAGFNYGDARLVSLKNQIDAWRRVIVKRIERFDETERLKAANSSWGMF